MLDSLSNTMTQRHNCIDWYRIGSGTRPRIPGIIALPDVVDDVCELIVAPGYTQQGRDQGAVEIRSELMFVAAHPGYGHSLRL